MNMLDVFKNNLKNEIDIKIKNAKEAWALLDQDKLTDGNSNSQADIDYSRSIKTPIDDSLSKQGTFQIEPDLKLDTEVINEIHEEDERQISNEDKSFIKKNMKIYNAYESKFIKPRSLAQSLSNTSNKSREKSIDKLVESKSS